MPQEKSFSGSVSLQLSPPGTIEAIANFQERRSDVMNNGAMAPHLAAQSGARSPTHTPVPNTDTIADVLQYLLVHTS
jgi:hypothetical protein